MRSETIIEYHPGRGYKVTPLVGTGCDYSLCIYSTKKVASDVARMGGWRRADVVKVWTPLYGGYMPAVASVRGDGKHTLIFLATNLTTYEFAIEELPRKREGAPELQDYYPGAEWQTAVANWHAARDAWDEETK